MAVVVPETVTLTLTVNVYNGCGEEDDYDEVKKCIIGSLDNQGEDALRLNLNHFVDVVFDSVDEETREELSKLAPSMYKLSSMDPGDTFLNFEHVSWRHTQSNVLGPDVWVGIEHSGYVMFDVEIPKGINKRIFLTEFNALFSWYSNSYVEWGWMDMGYVLDAPSIALADV